MKTAATALALVMNLLLLGQSFTSPNSFSGPIFSCPADTTIYAGTNGATANISIPEVNYNCQPDFGHSLRIESGEVQFNGLDFTTINMIRHYERTVEMQIKLDSTVSRSSAVPTVIWEEGGSSRGITIFVSKDSLRMRIWNFTAIYDISTYLPPDNQWHHLAMVFGGATPGYPLLKGYLDGNAFDSVSTSFYYLGVHPGGNCIGGVYISTHGGFPLTTAPFRGNIDEVRLWSVARTRAEINAFKNTELIGNENGLEVYMPFNKGNCSGDKIFVGNQRYTGTLSNFNLNYSAHVNPCESYYDVDVPENVVSLRNSYTNSTDASAVYPIGTTAVTWTATDCSGKSSSCQQAITVIDTNTLVQPYLTAVVQNPSCFGAQNGSIQLSTNANGIMWNDGVQDSIRTGLGEGFYGAYLEYPAPSRQILDSALVYISGNGNANDQTGTLNTLAQHVTFVPGIDNQAMLFNGTSSNVVFPDLTILPDTGNYSVSFWAKTTSAATMNLFTYYECGKACPAGQASGALIIYLQKGVPSFYMRGSNNQTNTIQGSDTLSDGQFHHFALSINRSTNRVEAFIDNQSIGSQVIRFNTIANQDGESDPFILGSGIVPAGNAYNNFFDGLIDEVRIQRTIIDTSNINKFGYGYSVNLHYEDITPPVAIAQNLTVQLDANGNASTTAAAIDNGSSDACGIASLALSQTSFDCSNVGANQVTLTVTDNNGNVSTANATVTVQDNVAPNAIAQNLTVQLDANGNASTTAAAIDNGSSDACGIASTSIDASSFDCSNVGANPVVLTVTDVNGNVSTANATVTVEDNVAPNANAQNVTVQLDAAGNVSTSAAAVDNGSNDACGIASVDLSQTAFDCSEVGANTVTLTVTDVNGNTSTANATVNVIATPLVTSVSSPTFNGFNIACNGAATGLIDLTVSQGCAPYSYAWSNGATTEDISGLTAGTYSVTVTDASGTVTASESITLTEPSPLSATASSSGYLSGNGVSGTTLYLGYGPQSINLSSTASGGVAPYTFSWLPAGSLTGANTANPVASPTVSTTYTVTATDANGCTFSTTVNVDVIDARCGKNLNKVLICHKTSSNKRGQTTTSYHNICVSANAVHAHLAHGDYLGPCVNSNKNDEGAVVEEEFDYHLYPNPTNDVFTVEIHSEVAGEAKFILTDVQGRMIDIQNETTANGITQYQFDLGGYAKGVYMLSIVANNQRFVERVIKQ